VKVHIGEFDSVTAVYAAAIIKNTSSIEEATLFLDYITKGKGKGILTKYGFGIE
jgi:ABC-type molybdate transport system substrate-binding protein